MRILLLSSLLLLLAVAGRSPAADFGTGMMAYQSGDYVAARAAFEPLAERGDKDAQFILGDMYAKGQGTPQDYVQAYKWYRLAAGSGARDADAAAADLAARMSATQLATARELVRNWRAASPAAAAVPTAPALPSGASAPPPEKSDSGFFSNLARGATGLFGSHGAAPPSGSTSTATIGIRGLSAADLRSASPNPAALSAMESFTVSPQAAADFAGQGGLHVVSVPYLDPAPAPAPVGALPSGR